MNNYKIAVIGGDGIGPEVIREGLKVIDAAAEKYNFKVETTDFDFGGERYLKTKEILSDSEVDELSSQLSAIVDWVEQLNEVNTENIEPLSNVSMAKLPLRKDLVNTEDNSKEILSNAPDKLENYFAVPKVVE